jgi:hypothetical protein
MIDECVARINHDWFSHSSDNAYDIVIFFLSPPATLHDIAMHVANPVLRQ